jgi:hypothetical protein
MNVHALKRWKQGPMKWLLKQRQTRREAGTQSQRSRTTR